MNNDLNRETVVDTKESSTVSEKKNSAKPAGAVQAAPKKRSAQNSAQNAAKAYERPKTDAKASERPKKSARKSEGQSGKPAQSNQKRAVQKKAVSKAASSTASTALKKPVKKAVASHPASRNLTEISSGRNDIFSSQKPESTEKKRKKKTAIAIPIFAAAAIILTAGVVVSSATLGIFGAEKHEAFIATKQSNVDLSSPGGKFLDGISVQGVDLGGKTMTEALDLLGIEESELIPSINYTLTCHDKIVYLTEDDFDFNFDTVKVLNEAFEYSQYLRDILIDEGRTSLRESEKKDYAITMTFDEDSVKKACKDVAKKVNVEMQDAHVTRIDTSKEEVSDMFSFEEGVVGYSIDTEDLETQINTLRKNEQFTADVIGQMEVVEPKVDLKDLKKNFVLISQYKTYSGNTWAGNMNMKVAMESMTGSIIKPGQVFSFNEKTGDSNLTENGYYAAGVIVNGASANGVGGGICQAATTIYNAAIRAGMTVVEREPHTWPSVYVPVGIDSAIDYGNIDMKFRNDTDHEVYLICYMEDATLYAYIYGYKPADFDEILVSSWFTGSSGSGFGAAASRSYYKDGELVKTEDLPASYYKNGGGTSYAVNEQLSDYVFKRVFTDKQIADDEKKALEAEKNGGVIESDDDTNSTDNSDTDSSKTSDRQKDKEEYDDED